MYKAFIGTIVLLTAVLQSFSQSVAINTEGTPAEPSAILDVKSIDKGVLFPRMSTFQRNNIVNPTRGLLVFDLDTESFWVKTNLAWAEISANSYWVKSGTSMYNANTGPVGIGTTEPDPNSKLHVVGDLRITGELHTNQIGPFHLLPRCYGSVDGTGNILGGSGNFSVTYNPIFPGQYTISIFSTNYDHNSFVTIVTPQGGPKMSGYVGISGNLIVRIYSQSGNPANSIFSFTVFSP